jgi:hypothetical protein
VSSPAAPEHNGLVAERYVPLTDVPPDLGPVLLDALGRSRIAAYLDAPPVRRPDGTSVRRLFVAAEERSDARIVVAAVIKASGATPPPIPEAEMRRADPLSGVDAEAAFADIIADWPVDTIAEIRKQQRMLDREDADWRARLEQQGVPNEYAWLDEQHYVPPVPPPLPRLSRPALVAVVVLLISIGLLVFGTALALGGEFALILGVCGVLVSGGILFTRLRRDRPDDDDGAVL